MENHCSGPLIGARRQKIDEMFQCYMDHWGVSRQSAVSSNCLSFGTCAFVLSTYSDVYCFIFRLDVGNAKVAISTRAGSREAIRNPITCAVASIFLKLHHILRRLEWLLLIPFNGVRTVLTTQGAREFC